MMSEIVVIEIFFSGRGIEQRNEVLLGLSKSSGLLGKKNRRQDCVDL